MKDIFNLMKLDLICIKNKTLIPMLIGMSIFAAAGFLLSPMLMLPIIFLPWFTVYTVFITAEKNGFNKLYGVLPISRSSFVYARFGFAVLLTLAAAAVVILLWTAAEKAALFESVNRDLADIFYFTKESGISAAMTAAIMIFLTCIIIGIHYSVVFICGSEKAKTAEFLIGMIGVTSYSSITDLVYDYSDILSESGRLLLYGSIAAVGVIIAAVFALITGAVIKKREL